MKKEELNLDYQKAYEVFKDTMREGNYLLAVKSALEKQIPKKPIDNRYPWCICPVCGGSVYLKNAQEHIMNLENTHCEHCGQKLDWGSDTNDR